jgi:hypothetical protein
MAVDRKPSTAKRSNPKSEKQKLILVALLTSALIFVLYAQFVASEQSVDVETTSPPVASLPTVESQPVAIKSPSRDVPMLPQVFEVLSLPSRSLDEILQQTPLLVIKFNPTTVPPSVEAAPIVVRAVYGSADKSIAIVGDKILRAGDVLPDGRKLIGASPNGLKMRSRLPISTQDASAIE